MSERSPHPPSPHGRVADLWRRGRLTLEYHGAKELAFRIVTAPLRPTPLGERLGHGRRYGAEEARAKNWYRRDGRLVTVVIPTYGDPGLVEQAVASVRKTTDRKRVRIIVVDDGSEPRHRDRLRDLRGARVELMPENRGFAGAVNRGLELVAPQDDVVVLNSDVIAERGWLERLQYTAYREPRIGIVGAEAALRRPAHPVRGVLPQPRRARVVRPPLPLQGGQPPRGEPDRARDRRRPAPACTSSARRSTPSAASTPGYGMAYEDMDYCLRALGGRLADLLHPARDAPPPRVADTPDRAGRARAGVPALLLAALGRRSSTSATSARPRAGCVSST